MFRWILKQTPLTLIGIAMSLLAIRWTLRDVWFPAAAIYYLAQPILIAVMFAAAALLARRAKRRRLMYTALILMLGMLGQWLAQSFRFRASDPAGPTRCAVVWNVMSGRLGWTGIFETLSAYDADLIVLVEAWQDPDERLAHCRTHLPGYHVATQDGGLVILSREPAASATHHRLGRGSRCLSAVIPIDGSDVLVVAVDIESDPRRFRKPPLDDLATLVSEHRGERILVAGDFNTPPDSAHYEPLRRMLRNAFETAGTGYAPTWPSFAPVWPLDQFWVSDDLTLYRCEADWTMRSDHRPLVLDFK